MPVLSGPVRSRCSAVLLGFASIVGCSRTASPRATATSDSVIPAGRYGDVVRRGRALLGNHGGSESYNLFIGLLRETRADLRETGALGLGELADARAFEPLSEALGEDDSPTIRMTGAWALGDLAEEAAIDALHRALAGRTTVGRRGT